MSGANLGLTEKQNNETHAELSQASLDGSCTSVTLDLPILEPGCLPRHRYCVKQERCLPLFVHLYTARTVAIGTSIESSAVLAVTKHDEVFGMT